MKQSKFLTRCIALALALVLLATSANLGAALKVFAAEGDKITVTAGELVANNYELTGPEKALLKSELRQAKPSLKTAQYFKSI